MDGGLFHYAISPPISRVVRYKKPVKGQRVEELRPVEVEGVEEWEVEKILNKRKIQGVKKYLVC